MSSDAPPTPTFGQIRRLAPGLDALIDPDARIEIVAEGFTWTEGPVWIDEDRALLFSDVPENRIYRWSENDGVSVFLDPSGYDGPDPSGFREPGANGLIRGPGNSILLADHGNRAIARLDLETRQKSFLASHYRGKRLNSPNDLVRASDGTIYFTDPPYGLAGLNESPLKELPFNGVYRIDPDGGIALLDEGVSFPNGIILSPDERTLYVACSDPRRAIWLAYQLDRRGGVVSRRVFADMTASVDPERRPGLPDGMAIDAAGNLFATGPGGIIIFAPDGIMLGQISVGTAIANCTFGEDGGTLFLAAHHRVARVRTRTVGLGSPHE
ncbi:MAG: SMP-30/gluconolactonase/LRE family protein [Alphaproteobacteria bacterium]|nr:SMP-30/gluconolactonase/LRE family protein [Alphaproteobacteria bacterium]